VSTSSISPGVDSKSSILHSKLDLIVLSVNLEFLSDASIKCGLSISSWSISLQFLGIAVFDNAEKEPEVKLVGFNGINNLSCPKSSESWCHR